MSGSINTALQLQQLDQYPPYQGIQKISPAAISDLSPTEQQTLTLSVLLKMSIAQIQELKGEYLTAEQLNGLCMLKTGSIVDGRELKIGDRNGQDQIQEFSLRQISRIAPEVQEQLLPEFLVEMTPSQIKALKAQHLMAEQLNGLSEIKLFDTYKGREIKVQDSLGDHAIHEFSPYQIAALPAAVQTALKPEFLVELHPNQVQALNAKNITAAQLNGLSEIRLWNTYNNRKIDVRDSLGTHTIKALSYKQISELPQQEKSQLAPEVLKIMSESQLYALAQKQVDISEIQDFSPAEIKALKLAHIKELQAAQISDLKPEQMNAFTVKQLWAFSANQTNALKSGLENMSFGQRTAIKIKEAFRPKTKTGSPVLQKNNMV